MSKKPKHIPGLLIIVMLLSLSQSQAQETNRSQDSSSNDEYNRSDEQSQRANNQSDRQFDTQSGSERERLDRNQDEETQGNQRNQNNDRRNQDGSEGNPQNDRTQRNSNDSEPAGLGVTIADDGNQGLRVRRVFRGSPAEQAGIRPNDEILEIDDQQVDSTQQLIQTIESKEPESQVRVRIIRNGRAQTLTARLDTRGDALNIRSGSSYPGGPPFENQRFQTPRGYNDLAQHFQYLEPLVLKHRE